MSDSYKVLTRKYRPRSFEDVVSQQHVIGTLRNAIEQNRISHAYLFCGPRGVGKTTMARVVARLINGIDMDIDGEDLSKTLDIIEIDAASNSGVDDVRNLRDTVRVPPQKGKYKVYIIDEVHMLSKQAFNALLKTLEEPPEYVKFIFATTEPHKVLPTVLSRCQRFDFRRIKVSEIVDRLRYICDQEGITIDDASLHIIARKADGALRDALSIMDQAIAFCGNTIRYDDLLNALNVVGSERLFELTGCIRDRNTARAIQIADELLLDGHDIQEFLIALTEHFRNLYLATNPENIQLIEATDSERKTLVDTAAQFSNEDLLRCIHIVNEAQFAVRNAQQPRIQLEITLLKLVTMERSEGLRQLLAEIGELKKKLRESGRALSSAAKEQVSSESTTPAGSFPADDNSGQASAIAETPALAQNRSPKSDISVPAGTSAGNETSGTGDEKETAAKRPDIPAKTTAGASANGQHAGVNGTANQSETAAQASSGRNLPDPDDDESPIAAKKFDTPSESTDTASEPGRETANFEPGPESHTPQDEPGFIPDEPDIHPDEAEIEPATPHVQKVYLHEVKERWEMWLASVKQNCQQLVYFSIMRIQPLDLKDNRLKVSCQDELVAQIIRENAERLGQCFVETLGIKLELEPTVRHDEAAARAKDPYQQFKMLQQKDPKVRMIVDLFGAELEY